MSSAGRDSSYYTKRQKNNEAAKLSRLKRKGKEIQAEEERKNLELKYCKLQKELLQMHAKRLEAFQSLKVYNKADLSVLVSLEVLNIVIVWIIISDSEDIK